MSSDTLSDSEKQTLGLMIKKAKKEHSLKCNQFLYCKEEAENAEKQFDKVLKNDLQLSCNDIIFNTFARNVMGKEATVKVLELEILALEGKILRWEEAMKK